MKSSWNLTLKMIYNLIITLTLKMRKKSETSFGEKNNRLENPTNQRSFSKLKTKVRQEQETTIEKK